MKALRDALFIIMKYSSLTAVLATLSWLRAGIINTPAQQWNQLTPVHIQSVMLDDPFWSPKREVWQRVTIPDCFTKFENDRGGALSNFDRVRDGKSDGHAGPPWYDGLIYEMISGSAVRDGRRGGFWK